MKKLRVGLPEIQAAKQVLSKKLPATPLLRNAWLSRHFGCQIYLKLENMQPIGSFKIRGAAYRISKLSSTERRRGVIAASAGNHAQGVAWGARLYGVSALIVMPKTASLMKVQNTQSLGAEVRLEGETYDEAYAAALKIAKKTGRVYIHAFEDSAVIAGQGTVGLEILEQLPDVNVVVSSIGGGGLLAGTGIAIRAPQPNVRLVGCQAEGAPAMTNALRSGRSAKKASTVSTFADGIAVGKASDPMRRLLASVVSDTHLADDEEIAEAVLMLMEKAKIVAEGAGALPVAILEKIKKSIRGKKVVLVIGGGNIDFNLLSRIIDQGMIQSGRRLRVNVRISDRPGSLNRLTELLAREGVNILQAIHDRNEPTTQIDETEVHLTLETKGRSHSRTTVQTLRKHCVSVDVIH